MTYLVVLSLLIPLLFSVSIKANPSHSVGTLKIGTMSLAPYGWQDKEGQGHGIIYELNQEIGLRLNIPFTNKIYPFKRMLKLLDSGQLDLISSQAHRDTLKSGEKLAIQHSIDVIAVAKKGSNIQYLTDLKGKNLIYHLSSSYQELEGFPNSITRTNNYRQSLLALHKGVDQDAAVFSEPAYYYWRKELGLTDRDFGNVVLITSNKYQWIFVRRGLADSLKKDIKKVVSEIYQQNLYQDLLLKYGKTP